MKFLLKLFLVLWIVMIPDAPLNKKSEMVGDCLAIAVPEPKDAAPPTFVNSIFGMLIVTTTPKTVFMNNKGESMVTYSIYDYSDPDNRIYETVPAWLYLGAFKISHFCPRGL